MNLSPIPHADFKQIWKRKAPNNMANMMETNANFICNKFTSSRHPMGSLIKDSFMAKFGAIFCDVDGRSNPPSSAGVERGRLHGPSFFPTRPRTQPHLPSSPATQWPSQLVKQFMKNNDNHEFHEIPKINGNPNESPQRTRSQLGIEQRFFWGKQVDPYRPQFFDIYKKPSGDKKPTWNRAEACTRAACRSVPCSATVHQNLLKSKKSV